MNILKILGWLLGRADKLFEKIGFFSSKRNDTYQFASKSAIFGRNKKDNDIDPSSKIIINKKKMEELGGLILPVAVADVESAAPVEPVAGKVSAKLRIGDRVSCF
jgi:hypothetical protein